MMLNEAPFHGLLLDYTHGEWDNSYNMHGQDSEEDRNNYLEECMRQIFKELFSYNFIKEIDGMLNVVNGGIKIVLLDKGNKYICGILYFPEEGIVENKIVPFLKEKIEQEIKTI